MKATDFGKVTQHIGLRLTGDPEKALKGITEATLPCGNKIKFQSLLNPPMPIQSIPCPCGDKSHWLVKVDE